MSDDLRTRIENVVEATIQRGTDCDAGTQCPKCLAAHVADEVIAELTPAATVPELRVPFGEGLDGR